MEHTNPDEGDYTLIDDLSMSVGNKVEDIAENSSTRVELNSPTDSNFELLPRPIQSIIVLEDSQTDFQDSSTIQTQLDDLVVITKDGLSEVAESESAEPILEGWEDVLSTTPPAANLGDAASEFASNIVGVAIDLNQRVSNWLHSRLSTTSSMSLVSNGVDSTKAKNIFLDSDLTAGANQENLSNECKDGIGVTAEPNRTIWLLGKVYKYHQETGWTFACKQDYISRPWFTYRSGFPNIGTSSYNNDIGWGCMMRTGQSLLAQSLIVRHLGRGNYGEFSCILDWRLSKTRDAKWSVYTRILSWFNDSKDCPFSLHRISITGEQRYGKRIGEWFGPHTMSVVIKFEHFLY